jgi:hypothetical protein
VHAAGLTMWMITDSVAGPEGTLIRRGRRVRR